MRRLKGRVQKIEDHRGQSRAVGRIVFRMKQASDEELYYMNKDGWLVRMAERLSLAQIEQLIAELKKMIVHKEGQHFK